ncbi:MAG: hypothetical protein NDP13_03130 [Crenarchaeota archaeon]|nr:hypothetical protein [Thermoproteota archaeon]MCR8455213.1 hypothetical protein [Thermoproteota archaeon]MCR8500876.1 hypothetical protein [Thermoproteota archaeon]
MVNEKKDVDLVQHFRKLILKDLKPLTSMLSEQVTFLKTFSRFFPNMLSLSVNSAINKVSLLYRLEDSSVVDEEVVSTISQTLNEMKVYIESSKAPNKLKAESLSVITAANLALGDYKNALSIVKKTTKLIDLIKDPVSRSVAIRMVLSNLGSINRLIRREFVNLPDEVVGQIASAFAQVVGKNLSEADLIQNSFTRGIIYANLGFGATMFHTIVNRGTIAEWFDVNQAQRLALDSLNEAEKTSNWYEKALLLADSSTVLAITGEDTVNLANEKFNEAAELAFKHISDNPKKAAYVIGRIAYDKAFTKFYIDSDKLFYESVAILIETLGVEKGISTIRDILRLIIKARYYYVAYEIIKDWILPMTSKIQSSCSKARLLATCSHIALPISTNWASTLAGESILTIRNVIEDSTLTQYSRTLISENISHIDSILGCIPALLEAAYVLPHESRKIISKAESIIEMIFRTCMIGIKGKGTYKSVHIKTLSRNLGKALASVKPIPAFYEALSETSYRLLQELGKALKTESLINRIYDALIYASFAHGISKGDPSKAASIAKGVIDKLFIYDKNMWRFKDEKLLERLAKNGSLTELIGDVIGSLVEVCFKVGGSLRDTLSKIIVDLSEYIEHGRYTKLLTNALSKIRSRIIARKLLMNVINVLVDEKKIQREDLSGDFLRAIKNIDPVLARNIIDELTL